MLLHYLKVAVRQLLKYRTQNLISIVGLGVCLLCFSICLYVGRFILATDHCFENRNRIAEVQLEKEDGTPYGNAHIPLAHQLAAQLPAGVEAVTFVDLSLRDYTLSLTSGEELPFQRLFTLEADSNYQRVFGAEVLAGSWEIAVHTPNAVVLTEHLAKRLFPHPSEAIGQRLLLTNGKDFSQDQWKEEMGNVAYTVQAVVKDLPVNNTLSQMNPVDLLTLNDVVGILHAYREANFILSGQLYALLRPGFTPLQLSREFRRQNLKMPLGPREYPVTAIPFGQVFWQNNSYGAFAVIALTLGTLILLVGLLNFFSFACGSYLNRLREYALRRVSGSRARQLLGLLFTQAVLTVVLAFIVAGCLTEIWVPRLYIPLGSFKLLVDGGELLGQCAQYLAGILLLTLAVCAAMVAYACRIPIQTGIRGTGSIRRGGKHIVRNALLAVQFFACWVFVTLAVALYLQTETITSALFNTLSRQQKEEILSIPLRYSFMSAADKQALVDRMKQHAGVEDCLLAERTYGNGMWMTSLAVDNEKGEQQRFDVNLMNVAPNFFPFMNLDFRQGRTMRDSTEVVIDARLAKHISQLTGKEAGNVLLYPWNDPPFSVCGVVDQLTTNAYTQMGRWEETKGLYYEYTRFDEDLGHCYLKCRPGQTDAVRRHVTTVLTEVLPSSIPIKVNTFQQDLEESCQTESSLRGLVLFFAIVCVVITLLGVYAAITLDTERRRKEVAIRKVNGAGRRQIFLLFARTYGWLLAGTAAVAFPLLYAILRESQEDYVVFFDYGPLFWLCIFLSVALATALTVVFRIRKIARLNPAEAIKTE